MIIKKFHPKSLTFYLNFDKELSKIQKVSFLKMKYSDLKKIVFEIN